MKQHAAIQVLASIFTVCFAIPVWAQAHERTFEDYVVRSSTVSTDNLSETTAEANGIQRSPQRAIINVTVSRKKDAGESTVPAQVAVSTIDPVGNGRNIEMRETNANGYVSYTGVYSLVGREGIEMEVKAQPKGSDKTLTLRFRDQVGAISNDVK